MAHSCLAWCMALKTVEGKSRLTCMLHILRFPVRLSPISMQLCSGRFRNVYRYSCLQVKNEIQTINNQYHCGLHYCSWMLPIMWASQTELSATSQKTSFAHNQNLSHLRCAPADKRQRALIYTHDQVRPCPPTHLSRWACHQRTSWLCPQPCCSRTPYRTCCAILYEKCPVGPRTHPDVRCCIDEAPCDCRDLVRPWTLRAASWIRPR